jgi:predicted aldo/keto reductase-like oxidoreductase
MDFNERVRFGKTGLEVGRMGLASGYGVPTASIEKAFHEFSVNYFYLSLLKRGNMVKAISNLASANREKMVVVLAKPVKQGFYLDSFVDRWLKKLNLDHADALVLQGVSKPPSQKLIDRAVKIKESGKVRFVGMSSHDRPLFGKAARGEINAPIDFFQIRYNAVHRGAEVDIFPHLSQKDRPGIVIFTATCWRKLLNPKLMPPGESALAPADCYRFVLSNPNVDVCITGPSTAEQMDQNLKAIKLGPLSDDEMARIRRIGDYIYGPSRK